MSFKKTSKDGSFNNLKVVNTQQIPLVSTLPRVNVPGKLVALRSNNDINLYLSTANSWKLLQNGSNSVNINTSLPLTGDGSVSNPITFASGALNESETLIWNGTNWVINPLFEIITNDTLPINADISTSYIEQSGNYTLPNSSITGLNKQIINNISRNWKQVFNGFNDSVLKLIIDGTKLYAGGSFTQDGLGNPMLRVAMIDFSDPTPQWQQIGNGLNDDIGINGLAVDGTKLYAGGGFTQDGLGNPILRVAMIDFSDPTPQWQQIGNGLNNVVNTLAVNGNTLYAGGDFTQDGLGNPILGVAKIDFNDPTPQWQKVGDIIQLNTGVNSLVTDGNILYAAGVFIQDEVSMTIFRVAQIDLNNPDNWVQVGEGLNQFVVSIILDGTKLYAGGGFTSDQGMPSTPMSAVAVIDFNDPTPQWQQVGNGLGLSVRALFSDGTELYAGGDFTQDGLGNPMLGVAKINFNDPLPQWQQIGNGLNIVSTLAVNGTELYAGGDFTQDGPPDETTMLRVAVFDFNEPLSAVVNTITNIDKTFNTITFDENGVIILNWNGVRWILINQKNITLS